MIRIRKMKSPYKAMFQDMNISPYKVMFNSKHAQWVEIIYEAVFWGFFGITVKSRVLKVSKSRKQILKFSFEPKMIQKI